MNQKDFSKYYTDKNVVRLIATQVIILALLSLMTGWIPVILLLTIDFAIRAFSLLPSPLAAIAKLIVHRLKLKPKPIFAAPKKFAALIGFVFSFSILALFLFKINTAAYVVGVVLIFCALLESVFEICLGCYVYDWLVAPIVNKRNSIKQQKLS